LPDKLVGLVTQALNKASRLSHRPARLDVVVPFDLVFDGIPGLGYLDDATVLAYAISCARDEIEAFRRWVNGNNDAQHQDGAARAGGES
jgi:hypothetical protein